MHPTAGTIFHKSSTGLQLWFYAMYLMTSTRCGISAKQLERELGVTYKTAWRMFKDLIRNELMVQDPGMILGDRVEMDETYVGGKPRASDRAKWDKPSRTKQSQAVSLGEGQEDAGFRRSLSATSTSSTTARPSPKSRPRQGHGQGRPQEGDEAHIVAIMDDHLKDDTVIYADDSRIYDRLIKDGFEHHKIAHSRGSYVRKGGVHTQQIEGFCSLLERGIHGAYHSVSPKWLQGYVNEYAWRYDPREDGREMFSALVLRSAFPIR